MAQSLGSWLLLFTISVASPACFSASGAEPDLDKTSGAVFRDGGFTVGSVSYAGHCAASFNDQCRARCDSCYSDNCSGFTGEYLVQCYEVCSDCDCSHMPTDRCAEYVAEFDFGSPDVALNRACQDWSTAHGSNCGSGRGATFCEALATTVRPEFAEVLVCSTAQAQAGVCGQTCEFPTSTLGTDLCAAAWRPEVGECSCNLMAEEVDLFGAVLREDVVAAAWACLELDGCEAIHNCLYAWGQQTIPR